MKIQLDLDEEINKQVGIYKLNNNLPNKKIAISKILNEFFKRL